MENLIFTGGKGPEGEYIRSLLEQHGYIIAADSGLDLCRKWGIKPDLIVGDMDSLNNPSVLEEYGTDKVRVYPCDKDDSDTEIALQEMSRFPDKPVLIGGGEGRLDHSLALIHLFYRDDAPKRWITGHEDIRLLKEKQTIKGWKGRRISIFSLDYEGMHCQSRGLQWELKGLEMGQGRFSLSNRMTGSEADIELLSGRGLMMMEIPR